jgi:cytochrome c biogenesis protein CcmG/thiol:disulfide interchange protein DsbE
MRRSVTAAALLAAACATAQPSSKASTLVGKPVSVRAADLEGKDHDVGGDDGKVRVVDFWATWCDPCRDQLPFLGKLSERYGAQGLAIYAVSFDEDRSAVERFLSEMHPPFTVLWDKGGDVLSDPNQVTRLPTTLFVDKKGIVRDVHLGFEKSEEKKLEALVQRLLSE